MKRMKLLSLQILVMLVFLAIWHVVTTTSLFGDVKTMQFFFSTPSAVLTRTFKQLTSGDIYYHLGIIWSKVALGFTLVFFIVFFNVYQGVREVSPTILSNARMLGMNERQLFKHVYWPSALTWMFSSLHTSVGFALVGAVVGEYLGSSAGLGYKIHEAESVFDVTGVFAGMLILAIFVIAIDSLVTVVEKRLLVWRPGQSSTTAT